MDSTAGRISTWRKAKVIPTARASMEVATARGSMAPGAKEQLSSSPPPAPRTMFAPIIDSRAKAIQWSMETIASWNCAPSSQPIRGIRAWKPPNQAPQRRQCPARGRPADSPLHTDTAKASIDRLTARIRSSYIRIKGPPG